MDTWRKCFFILLPILLTVLAFTGNVFTFTLDGMLKYLAALGGTTLTTISNTVNRFLAMIKILVIFVAIIAVIVKLVSILLISTGENEVTTERLTPESPDIRSDDADTPISGHTNIDEDPQEAIYDDDVNENSWPESHDCDALSSSVDMDTERDQTTANRLQISSVGRETTTLPIPEAESDATDEDFDDTVSDSTELKLMSSEPPIQRESKQELDLLLIGKTGHGKSSTGNAILGTKHFATSAGGQAETFNVQEACADVGDYIVKVVDGPGLSETRMGDVEGKEKACSDMAEAMIRCPLGFHALLLILKFGARYTAEEQEAVEMLRRIFGEDFIREYCVIIVTNGDSFDLHEYNDFSHWLTSQKGNLKKLFIECSYRCVLFRNLTKEMDEQREQRNCLFNMVRQLRHRDVRYTNILFNKVQKQRDQLIVEAKAPQLKEKITKQTGLIISDIKSLSGALNDLDENEMILYRLGQRVEELLDEISQEDKETGTLDNLRKLVSTVAQTVKLEQRANAQRKEDRKEQDLLKQNHELQIVRMMQQCEEDKKLCNEQIRNASDEEKAVLLNRMEQLNSNAQAMIREERQKYDLQMKKLQETESKKWEGRLEEMKIEHSRQIKDLQAEHTKIIRQNKKILNKQVQELKEQLEELQQQKPPPKDPNSVSLRCVDSQGRSGSFVLNKNEPMGKLMRAFCESNSLTNQRFMFDTKRIRTTDTPDELGLEDGDLIEVFEETVGGLKLRV